MNDIDHVIGRQHTEIFCKSKIAESVEVVFYPKLGVMCRDDNSLVPLRSGNRISSNHDDVYIYTTNNCYLSHEYVVYDQNVVYLNTSLTANAGRSEYHHKRRAEILNIARSAKRTISREHEDQHVFVAHNEGGGTWGHYLIQNLPKMLLAKAKCPSLKLGLPSSYIYNKGLPWYQLLAAAGFSAVDLIPLDREKTYFFKKISFCDFLWDFASASPHPLAIEHLKAISNVNARGDNASHTTGRRVFIERDQRYARGIKNVQQIKDICVKFGIEVHKTTNLSVSEQIELFRSADFIIGTLGSDLTNIVFCRPDTCVLSLSPKFHGDNFFYNLSAAFGLIWNEILCTTSSKDGRGLPSFVLDPHLFLNSIKDILRV